MVDLVTAWTLGGAAAGAVLSVGNGMMSHSIDSNNPVFGLFGILGSAAIGAVVIGGGAKLYYGNDNAAEAQQSPQKIEAAACVQNAPANVEISFSKGTDGRYKCVYTPK